MCPPKAEVARSNRAGCTIRKRKGNVLNRIVAFAVSGRAFLAVAFQARRASGWRLPILVSCAALCANRALSPLLSELDLHLVLRRSHQLLQPIGPALGVNKGVWLAFLTLGKPRSALKHLT